MSQATTTRPNVSYGDADTAYANEILRTVVGSGAHGIAIAGSDDYDEMGVFVEPPHRVIGLDIGRVTHNQAATEHYVYRTQPEGVPSGPGDTDRVIYSLRKFLRLAAKGNPTMLVPLFAAEADVIITTPLGEGLRMLGPAVLSRHAVHRFLAYSTAQRNRMTGTGSRHAMPNRPDLVARYGYDVKYASHALRLAYQGLEVAATGRLTLPMPESERGLVLAVKRGEHTQEFVLQAVETIAARIQDTLDRGLTPLPEYPNLGAINGWSIDAHRLHWGWTS